MEDVNKINLTNSVVTSDSGGGLTPITVQENIPIESVVVNDSGLETTPSRIDENSLDENNITQSVVISEAGAKSTPIATRIKERELSIDDLINFIKSSFKEQQSNFDEKFDTKFDKLSSDFNELNTNCENNFNKLNKRLDIHDHKLDEIKSDINKMKLQNFNIDKRINDIDERCNVILEQVITVNDNLKSFASKAGNKLENGVSKSDTVDNSSDNESRMRVEVDQGLLVSVYDLEREYRDSLNVDYEQRANFSCGIGEGKASQVLLEDKSSSIVFVEDKRVFKMSNKLFVFIW